MELKKKQYKILVVEDNISLRSGIVATLEKDGYSVDSAVDGEEGLTKSRTTLCNLMITDIKMPKIDGLKLFKMVKSRFPAIDIIVITAFATVDIAVDAIKNGAEDFITKPFPLAELRTKVSALYDRWENRQKITESSSVSHQIIGNSEATKKIRVLIQKVAGSDSPVLITGESGTGKELVARSIHESGKTANGPFIAVNCGALTESLLESELFGHEKGAFTGAIRAHAGKIEQAAGGTLFLDEIGDMPLNLQVKLLRVLQTKQFQRVGGEKFIHSNFRLISATNKDLEKAVKEKLFRSELYYRINVIPIHIPSLAQRREDIPLLIDYILQQRSKKLNRSIPRIQTNVLRKLQAYSWPGNVRELENFIERALVFIEDNIFTEELFSFDEKCEAGETDQPIPGRDMVDYINKIEREMILTALKDHHGTKQRAADQLNIKAGTLYYKMEKYGIEEHEYET
ncbi:MAG: sigma-54 dependent transcriptional regulator [Candidatus Marinimicrobia bacterium]|nr:sigma-54 dependent transcriptional regulator [Candidatus Neomarinimicrobiota bacterium]